MANLAWHSVAFSLFKAPIRLVQILHSNALSYWIRHYNSQVMPVRDQPAIIISPHQDDETLGCGGLIALKRQQRSQVAIVFLTDGGASQPLDSNCQNLVDLRRQEAIAALNILGVSTSDIYFLDYPDGKLQGISESEQQKLVTQLSALLEQYQAQEVYVPHYKDGHGDHEAAFRVTAAALSKISRTIELFQYPIWLFWNRPLLLKLKQQDLAGAYRLNISTVKAKKHEAIQVYQSQLPVLPFGFLNLFLRSTEVFFARPINPQNQPLQVSTLIRDPQD